MSIKNTKLRLKDIRHGVVMYTAHPVYGIEVNKILSKPYRVRSPLSGEFYDGFWADTVMIGTDGRRFHKDKSSLKDAGIHDYYNYRRSFRTRAQAERWMEAMKNDPGFIEHQRHHEAMNAREDSFFGDFLHFDDMYDISSDFAFIDDDNTYYGEPS